MCYKTTISPLGINVKVLGVFMGFWVDFWGFYNLRGLDILGDLV